MRRTTETEGAETWAEQRAQTLQAAQTGTHPHIVVDFNAPQETIDLESDHPKVRLSPDIFREIVPYEEPEHSRSRRTGSLPFYFRDGRVQYHAAYDEWSSCA